MGGSRGWAMEELWLPFRPGLGGRGSETPRVIPGSVTNIGWGRVALELPGPCTNSRRLPYRCASFPPGAGPPPSRRGEERSASRGLRLVAALMAVLFLDPVRKRQPRITARPVDGDGRLWERGIGERADRNRDRVRPALGRPEHRRAAVRAEAKRPFLAGV